MSTWLDVFILCTRSIDRQWQHSATRRTVRDALRPLDLAVWCLVIALLSSVIDRFPTSRHPDNNPNRRTDDLRGSDAVNVRSCDVINAVSFSQPYLEEWLFVTKRWNTFEFWDMKLPPFKHALRVCLWKSTSINSDADSVPEFPKNSSGTFRDQKVSTLLQFSFLFNLISFHEIPLYSRGSRTFSRSKNQRPSDVLSTPWDGPSGGGSTSPRSMPVRPQRGRFCLLQPVTDMVNPSRGMEN